ncbi:MAG: ABC transporter substrate-binding protein, partial [Desulfotomaculales bacterium]
VTSKCTIPISKVANDNKVVLVTPTATNPKVTVDEGKRKEYIFRACFIDPFQGTVAAKFALEKLKLKTAAVLYDQGNDYTIGLANYFKDAFEKGGGKVLAFEAYSQGDTDFSAVLTKIAGLNPDILYLPDYYQKVSLIGKQARGKGIKAVFMGGDGWDSKDLDFAAMDGGYFTNHYSADDPRPEVKTWVQQYKDKYHETPDALATLAYDATKLLLNAIKTANSDDPAKIKDAMQATKDFSTVSGKVTFDKDGNPVKAAAILQIKDGKQVYVDTVAP